MACELEPRIRIWADSSVPGACFRFYVPPLCLPLNIMSSKDKYFSQANPYLGNHEAVGNCSKALQGNPNARIVLIKDAPHTLMNEPEAREAEDKFLKDVLLK